MKLQRNRKFNRMMQKGISIVLSAVMLSTAVSAFAVTSDTIVYRTEATLSDGLRYETLYAQKDDLSQEGYLFTYTPGKSTLPIFTSGEGVYGKETITEMAALLTAAGYDVAGGVNGDFYSTATGIPLGVLIDNGKILSSDADENAIGIRANGSYIIGQPDIGITLHKTLPIKQKEETAPDTETETAADSTVPETPADDASDTSAPTDTETKTEMDTDAAADTEPTPALNIRDITVSHINKYPSVWGAYLCTPDYGETTQSTEASTEIVFRLDRGSFAFGETIMATVTEIRKNKTNGDIPEDGFVIVVHNNYKNAADYADFLLGEVVTLTLTAADGWKDVTLALGGGDILCENGAALTDSLKTTFGNSRNPRTAIGYTAAGALLVFAVDGRSSNSRGMTLTELADTMVSFGCIGALNLDGGGSTTVLVKAENGTLTVDNVPSDGSVRKISNAVLFVNTAVSDGVPYFVEITPGTPLVYGSAPVQFDVKFYDKSHRAVPVQNAEITWAASGGYMTADGVFTPSGTNDAACTIIAQITTPQMTCTAMTQVYPIDTLDAISVSQTEITIPFGGTSAPAAVYGIKNNRYVYIDPAQITAAFVTNDGTGSAEIVFPNEPTRCDYGYIDAALSIHNTADTDVLVTALAKNGFPQMMLTMTLSDNGVTHAVSLPVTFGAAPQTVFAMEDRAALDHFVADDTGTLRSVSGEGYGGTAALQFTGIWMAPMTTPAADNPVKRIDLYVKGDVPADLYAVLTQGDTHHTLPWTVSDDFSRLTGWKRLSLDLDAVSSGGMQDFSIDLLLASGAPFTLTIDNLTYDFGDTLPVFTDIAGSWAEDSILAIRRMGVTNGIANSDGTYSFNPAGQLSRAEFAVMISAFAGLDIPDAPKADDPTLYLSFADTAETAAWALPYIKAVTDAGLMKGKTAADSTAIFAASDTMTRAEVLQVLGSLLPRTAETATAFADDASIPAWARDNIAACVEAGIISGFADNTIRPSATITRAEIAALLVRMNGILN